MGRKLLTVALVAVLAVMTLPAVPAGAHGSCVVTAALRFPDGRPKAITEWFCGSNHYDGDAWATLFKKVDGEWQKWKENSEPYIYPTDEGRVTVTAGTCTSGTKWFASGTILFFEPGYHYEHDGPTAVKECP